MPGNLFPDPAQNIINSIQSSQAPESPVTEKTTASLESPDAQESDNSKVNHPVHDIADIFRLYWKDYQSSNPVTECHYKVVYGADPKWIGGKTGFFMVLHTWGQQLPVHPHIHCVIPAGAYNEDTCEWVWSKYEKDDFLFPVYALSDVFRGKFIHGLKKIFYNCHGQSWWSKSAHNK